MPIVAPALFFSPARTVRAAMRTAVRSTRRFVITARAQFRSTLVLGSRCVVGLSSPAVIIRVLPRTIYVPRRRTRNIAVHFAIARSVLRFRM